MGHRRRRHHRCRRLSVALIVAFAALGAVGCTLSGALRPQTYTVQRGDSLYSIASSYGLDWQNLARWNHVRPPYRIEVGQRLTLDPYPPLDYGDTQTPRVVRAPQDSRAEQERAIQASTPQLTRTIEHGVPSEPERAPAAPPPDPVADESEIIEASERAPIQPTRTGGPREDGWQWPASGSILREYGAERTRRGVDIGGRPGSPVYAASSGRVVYNGTGLKGYGKLVIIQHDEHYLSAYGFNRRTRVEQGQDVAAGTHIADMGLGPQNKPMLHFEVRRDGEPIDPASVLPAH